MEVIRLLRPPGLDKISGGCYVKMSVEFILQRQNFKNSQKVDNNMASGQ